MSDDVLNLAVIGGGAAGYFAALRAAAESPGTRICIFESNRRPLEKVRISGGGRCNVTHHCFDPAVLVQHYPRGHKELLSAFHRFQPQHMLDWLAQRGVEVKAEDDGRMFPVSDQSSTIIDCFESERRKLGIELVSESKIDRLVKSEQGEFLLTVSSKRHQDHSGRPSSREVRARNVLLATGNHPSGHAFAREFGHSITALAPSLFTFNVRDEKLNELSGISVPDVEVELLLDGKRVASSSGALLVTHWGLSGPAILKLSAWAAREIYAAGYKGILQINWCAGRSVAEVHQALARAQSEFPRKTLARTPLFSLPARLWDYILRSSHPEICDRPWSQVGKPALNDVAIVLTRGRLSFDGKGQFKDEFVTCGGVKLSEIDFRSMQSKSVAGLFFAGEILDIDGITGGFNFQSAWTCGWIAGAGIAARISQ